MSWEKKNTRISADVDQTTLRPTHLDIAWLSHFLSSWQLTGLVGVDEISHGATKSRLKDDTRQGEKGELRAIPVGHAANEDVRVGCKFAELKFLSSRRFALRDAVDR